MADTLTPKARSIRFERTYDGPVEELWALWTTKEGIEEWFAPEGCRVEVSALEPRVGGAFDHVMVVLGSEQVATMERLGMSRSALVRGRFVEVVPQQRLHLRMTVDFVPRVEPYPYDIVVELHAEGERVRMVVTADAHPDPEMTRLASEALAGQLRQLEAALLSRGKQVPRG